MFHVSRSNNSGPHGVIKRIRQGIDVVMATVAEKRQVKENKKEKVNKIMSPIFKIHASHLHRDDRLTEASHVNPTQN